MKLTVEQTARELQLSPVRVRALIRAGRLAATRMGPRMYLIDSRALEAVRVRKAGRPRKEAGK